MRKTTNVLTLIREILGPSPCAFYGKNPESSVVTSQLGLRKWKYTGYFLSPQFACERDFQFFFRHTFWMIQILFRHSFESMIG